MGKNFVILRDIKMFFMQKDARILEQAGKKVALNFTGLLAKNCKKIVLFVLFVIWRFHH